MQNYPTSYVPLQKVNYKPQDYEEDVFLSLLKSSQTVVNIQEKLDEYSMNLLKMLSDTGFLFTFTPDFVTPPHTLDSLLYDSIDHLSAIRSRAEGYEPVIIQGAQRIIERDKPMLLIEYWPWAMKERNGNSFCMMEFLTEIYRPFIVEHNKILPYSCVRLRDFTKNPGDFENKINLLFVK